MKIRLARDFLETKNFKAGKPTHFRHVTNEKEKKRMWKITFIAVHTNKSIMYL